MAPSSYFKKSPPVQIPDDIARELVEEFIKSPKAVEARMRVAPPALKREAAPAAKRAKAGADGQVSPNGHQPARAAAKKPRRRTTTAR